MEASIRTQADHDNRVFSGDLHEGRHVARFVGKYSFAVDPKGRINVPARFRKLLTSGVGGDGGANSFIVSRGYELCLMAYPMDMWEALEEANAELDWTNDDVRYYLRYLNSNADEHSFDKQGRIVLSRDVRKWTHIKDDVLIVGGGRTHFEIFSPEIYQSYLDGTFRYASSIDAKYVETARKAHATIRRLSAT